MKAWRAALLLVDSRLVEDNEFNPDPLIRIELRFHSAFKSFRAGPTSVGLRACLEGALELVRVINDRLGHHLCGRDTHWANVVLTRGLSERLPLVYRWGIANLFEEVFFSVCGDGEKPISTLGVPDNMRRKLRKGQVVASSCFRVMDPYRREEPSDSGPWFVDEFEEYLREYQGWSVGQLLGIERSARRG